MISIRRGRMTTPPQGVCWFLFTEFLNMRRNIGLILASSTAFIAAGSAFAQVAGDECATALTVVADQAVNFNTTTMTASANPPEDGTCPFLDWGASKDIWYKFTPATGGLATISLCGSSYDTSMVVYTGTCAGLTRVACDDDTCGALYESIIEDFGIASGTTYYIRIGGWNADDGAGTMLISVTPVTGGCDGATGACNQPHGGPGCDTPSCCSLVCASNPLCCDLGWDLSCVETAVDLCGVFYYTCQPGGPSNNCATNATTVTASGTYSFNSTGATMDGPNHPGATCQSGGDSFYNDVWWKFVAPANGICAVTTCGTTPYDNKLAAYGFENTGSPDFNTLNTALVACNDDGTNCLLTDGVTPYASALSFQVTQGRVYYVRMGSYTDGETGSGQIAFTLPQPCQLPSPTGTENEVCGSSGNGGCNDTAGGFPTQPIEFGQRIAGTFWGDGDTRDTDWYSFTVTQDSQVTVNVYSASFSTVLLIGGTCDTIQILNTGAGACPNVASACLRPGNYKVFVASQAFEGLPCGSGTVNNYVIEMTASPSVCPVFLATTCDNPGPDSATINNDTANAGGGLVACAVAGAAGGTTVNSFARVFQAGTLGGEISCLDFGIWAVRVQATGNFASDIPLPGTIGIYRDIDGGAPRYKQVTPGDGGDLVPVFTQAFFAPGGAYKATLNFEEPLCIDEFSSQNLVVILDCPNLLDGSTGIPANSGYQLRAGGNTAGPGQNTYCRLSCADAAGQYVTTETLGAAFTAQWVVVMNGTFSSCDAGGIPGDLNGDGVVNAADLAILLGQWGGPGSADLNGDGTVSAADLAILLGAWG